MAWRPCGRLASPKEHEAIAPAAHARTAARLFGLILVFVATLVSCAEQDEVWGTPRETFAERLESGNYDFLRHLDYRELDLEEVTRLRPGAALYVAEIYGELELDRMRRRMLAVELEYGSDPWRRRAAVELLAQLEAEERYGELGNVAETALELYPREKEFLYARYLSLYERGADRELRDALESETAHFGSFSTRTPGTGGDRKSSCGARSRRSGFARTAGRIRSGGFSSMYRPPRSIHGSTSFSSHGVPRRSRSRPRSFRFSPRRLEWLREMSRRRRGRFSPSPSTPRTASRRRACR